MFKLSSEATLDGAITVENIFIVEYMPYADGDYVKVYLYGLSLAARKSDGDDSVVRLARRLDIDVATVDAAIDYWTELGLMSRLGDDICYFSPRSARPKIKKFDIDKYREFNRHAQLYISARQISPNEFGEYYAIMEKLNIEWQAMVNIVKYCVDLKGNDVGHTYILAVARNLAQDGYRTADEVADKLDEYGVYYNDVKRVLTVMGGKRPDYETVQLYKKWKTVYKFDADVIYSVAESIKRGGATALDIKLTQYRELGLCSSEQITEYEQDRMAMYKLAKSVNKALGLYYDNVDPEISMYIRPWLNMGLEQKAIILAAEYCMKKDLKRLSDLDAVVRDLVSNGFTSEDNVREKINREHRFDTDIENIFKTLGIKGGVKDIHRAFYSNWADVLKMSKEVIAQAAAVAVGKDNAFAYMNAVIKSWHDSGVKTVRDAVSIPPKSIAPDNAPTGIVYERYTEEQLNAMLTVITEDD